MKLPVLCIRYVVLIFLLLGCSTNTKYTSIQFDQNFNTKGVSIYLGEISRSHSGNDEIAKYSFYTKGLPIDKRYSLYILRESLSSAEPVFERYQVNETGKLFSYDNGENYHEIILPLCNKYICGESINIVLHSTDDLIKAYTRITPFTLAAK